MGRNMTGWLSFDVECRDDDVCEGSLELQLRAASRFEHFDDRFSSELSAV
jgi:hypothetical protein